MITETIERWHRHLRGDLPGGLDDLLHDDCVFWSPVLFHPQHGKELTRLYLDAAYQVMPGDPGGGGDVGGASGQGSSFRYTKQVLDGNHAVLEFETRIDDVEVNGVDIITCDDDGRIVEFKVMLRPQKAIEAVRSQMAAMLARLSGEGG